MAGLFGRIFRQWFESAIVDKLADSKAMQNLAVGAVRGAKEAQRLTEAAAKDPAKVTQGLAALFEALKQEASRDISSALGTQPEAPPPPPPPPCPWRALSVRELQGECAKRAISTAGLLEKSELVGALREHSAAAAAGAAGAAAKGKAASGKGSREEELR